ncbi:MAG: hypothetical protein ISS53_05905 [Dehalococcoidia bacterium]|nr:hypothetical protein [Dehalococcoidia bacterium]
MSTGPRRYLGDVRTKLRLDSSSKRETLCELHAHFEDQVEELKEAGFSEEEAASIAARSFGPLKEVADELNEVHSSSNWAETLVAALPHFLFAVLFALHQWSNIGWLLIILICTVGVAIYGWQHNKPTWFFTWLGYALIPLLVVGFFLLEHALSMKSLGSGWWVWLLLAVYFPVILWLLIHIIIRVLRRDWLMGSLMALPIPPIVGWFMTAQWKEELLGGGKDTVHSLEPWIALSFLTLAGIVVLFSKLKQRPFKVGALLVCGLGVVILIACSSGGNFGLLNMVVMISIIVFLLLGPALLEHKVVDQDVESLDHLLEDNLHRWAGGG